MDIQRSFAISDIHGCSKTFKKLVESKISLQKEDKLYLLGDYIDRGNDSKGVLDYCIELKDKGYDVTFLKGNHEQMMLDSLNNRKAESTWLRHGGRETLKSFGVNQIGKIDSYYFDFLNNLEYYIELDKYILVHASLNFDIKNPFSDKVAMLWSRNYDVIPEKIDNKKIIHGHTPFALNVILGQSLERENEISIDSGCAFEKKKEGMGYLIALALHDGKFYYEKNID